MFSELSPTRLLGFVREMSVGAGEDLTHEVIGDTMYLFGSEVATLRLFYKYNNYKRCTTTNCGYSDNLASFYFSIRADVA